MPQIWKWKKSIGGTRGGGVELYCELPRWRDGSHGYRRRAGGAGGGGWRRRPPTWAYNLAFEGVSTVFTVPMCSFCRRAKTHPPRGGAGARGRHGGAPAGPQWPRGGRVARAVVRLAGGAAPGAHHQQHAGGRAGAARRRRLPALPRAPPRRAWSTYSHLTVSQVAKTN